MRIKTKVSIFARSNNKDIAGEVKTNARNITSFGFKDVEFNNKPNIEQVSTSRTHAKIFVLLELRLK